MSNTEDTSVEALVGLLRADVTPIMDEARERIGLRFAGGALTVLVGGATLKTAAAGAGLRAFLHSKIFAVALALPIGAVLGATGHAWVTGERAALLRAKEAGKVAPAVAAPSVVAPSVVVDSAAEPTPSRVATAALLSADDPHRAASGTTGTAVSIAASTPGALDRQLSLLEQARSRLSEGDPAATLTLLRAHRASYPSSPLEQERQALTVKALVAAGRPR